jgi:hypothetical protein
MAKKDEHQYYEELLDSEQEQKKFKKAAISLRQAYGDECLKHNIEHLWELNYKLTEDCRIAFEKFTKCKNKIEKKFKFEFPVNCYSDDLPLGFSDYFMDNYIHKSNSEVSHGK